ncbi:MAG TPA: formyltransferase family protein [Gemmatimonadales bacterium]|nr:formyltransferase family protein [Gemmatimonadales bacterium]
MLSHQPRVAVLSTTRAPGINYLLGRAHLVAFVATDPANRDLGRVADAGVPAAVRDIRAFYGTAGLPLKDLELRRAFDHQTAVLLAEQHPDLIITCGYLHILTAPLLETYRGRIVNVHDSDLPSYPGLHATRDAVIAGERSTRSVVHVVTSTVDTGPVLVRSWPFPTHPLLGDARRWGAVDILKAYAYAQREWMMRSAWGPLMDEAIRCFADGAAVPRTLDPPEPAAMVAVARSAGAA